MRIKLLDSIPLKATMILVVILLSSHPLLPLYAQESLCDLTLHFSLLSHEILRSPATGGKTNIFKSKKVQYRARVENAVSQFKRNVMKFGRPALNVCANTEILMITLDHLRKLEDIDDFLFRQSFLKKIVEISEPTFWDRLGRIKNNPRNKLSKQDEKKSRQLINNICVYLSNENSMASLLDVISKVKSIKTERDVNIIINDCKRLVVRSPAPNVLVVEDVLASLGRPVGQTFTGKKVKKRAEIYETDDCNDYSKVQKSPCKLYFVGHRYGISISNDALNSFVFSHELGHYLGLAHVAVFSDEERKKDQDQAARFPIPVRTMKLARMSKTFCEDWDRHLSGVTDTPPSLIYLDNLKQAQVDQGLPIKSLDQVLSSAKSSESWPKSCNSEFQDFSKKNVPLDNIMNLGGSPNSNISNRMIFTPNQIDAMKEMASRF